ncbi:hypothetical protein B0T18DRAFT_229237 [Schizothecium vesticola]|uniref:Uncharacterized protein n=1 Tax=Schizothecium vesticola TaxID=314040 RepID=A0AA40EL62_9PEZI|nr:hypothetical protein B0T18DRAFT_229237 [Schizothecium vesticola]
MGTGVEVWVGLCFWTLTQTSARGGNGHCYGVYLVLAVMFTGVVLADSHTIRHYVESRMATVLRLVVGGALQHSMT